MPYRYPQYRLMTFSTQEEFNKWLNEKTKYIIHFEYEGQDFLRWHLDKHGEVLGSKPYHIKKVWNGYMVNLDTIKVGQYIKVFGPVIKRESILSFKVIKVEVL